MVVPNIVITNNDQGGLKGRSPSNNDQGGLNGLLPSNNDQVGLKGRSPSFDTSEYDFLGRDDEKIRIQQLKNRILDANKRQKTNLVTRIKLLGRLNDIEENKMKNIIDSIQYNNINNENITQNNNLKELKKIDREVDLYYDNLNRSILKKYQEEFAVLEEKNNNNNIVINNGHIMSLLFKITLNDSEYNNLFPKNSIFSIQIYSENYNNNLTYNYINTIDCIRTRIDPKVFKSEGEINILNFDQKMIEKIQIVIQQRNLDEKTGDYILGQKNYRHRIIVDLHDLYMQFDINSKQKHLSLAEVLRLDNKRHQSVRQEEFKLQYINLSLTAIFKPPLEGGATPLIIPLIIGGAVPLLTS